MIFQLAKPKLRGTTLVELLLYIVVASILAIILSTFLNVIQQSNTRNQVILQTGKHADSAMELIMYFISSADTVNSPTPGNTNNSIDLTVSGQSVQIYLSGSQIQIDQGGTVSVITSDEYTASNLSFENKAAGSYDSLRASFDLTTFVIDNSIEKNYDYTAIGATTRYQ